MFEGFTSGRETIGDVEIAYRIGGSGPPVLLLHGFPQSMALWARVAPLMAERYTIVCADLRGYGGSAKPEGAADNSTYSFRAMAGDQVCLMRHLGFGRFHMIGHDRGGRTAHRMALDHPRTVASLALLDIVPTYTMFMDTNRKVASAYWHWYFLSQPAPFPERMIGYDPDFFYETCLAGWGAMKLADFDPDMLAEYRRAWRDPAMIHASCCDYRAGATVDLEHDTEDRGRKVECPSLVFHGADGYMAKLFDIAATWRECLADMSVASLPGGHFFIDQYPKETADILLAFLDRARRS